MADAPVTGSAPAGDAADDPPCILVVDDESAITEEIVDWLELRGVACHAAPEAGQAMKLLEADPAITVMLTDINMPGIDGIALSSQALATRGEEHAMEVVVLTGHATRDHAIGALKARAMDFVAKPAPFATLQAALDRAHQSAISRRRRFREQRRTLDRLRASITGLQAAASAAPGTIDSAARDTFLTAVGHEVLTALHQIVGFSDLIGRGPEQLPIAELREYAEALLSAGTNLSEHTKLLLQLVESEAVPRPLALATVELAPLLGRVARAEAARAGERRGGVAVDCPPGLALRTDARRLEEALGQLLTNALRAATDGAVLLAARPAPSGGVELHVVEAADSAAAALVLAQAGSPPAEGHGDGGYFRDGQGLAVGIAGLHAARLGGRLVIPRAAGGRVMTLHLPADGPADGAS